MTTPISPPARKNPQKRTRVPVVPPDTRSRAALGLSVAAARGRFMLQVCTETPAEYNFFNIIGGDVVGMSTIPEVLVAKHMNLPVLVVSVISNRCFPIDEITETTLEEVIQVVNQAESKLTLILKELLEEL